MVFSLTFRVIWWLIGLVVVLSRRDLSNEIELLVLRPEPVGRRIARSHVLAMRRPTGSGSWRCPGFCLAAASTVFPVTPATILRWHRDLVARRWCGCGNRVGLAELKVHGLSMRG
jgi:putative transposase